MALTQSDNSNRDNPWAATRGAGTLIPYSQKPEHEHCYQPLPQPFITDTAAQRVMLFCNCGDVIAVLPRNTESGAANK